MKNLLLCLLSFVASLSVSRSAVSDFLWAQHAGGPAQDYGKGIAVDPTGNVFVSGYFSTQATFGSTFLSSLGNQDVFIAKYDKVGTLIWVKQAGGGGNDSGQAIAADSNGNCYITGVFDGSISFGGTTLTSTGGNDFFVAKYDSSGNLVWAKSGGGPLDDVGNGISVDAEGNSYITGVIQSAAFGDVGFLAKYSSSGDQVWLKNFQGTGQSVGTAIAVDSFGNCSITGYFDGQLTFGGTKLTSAGTYDVFVLSSDPAGNLQWAVSDGGTNNDRGVGIALDKVGNSYVTGTFSGTASFNGNTITSGASVEGFVAKYNSSGVVQWVKQLKGDGLRQDEPWAIAVNQAGDSYITGQFFGTTSFGGIVLGSNDWDVFISELDPDGNFLWAKNAGGGSGEAGYGIAVDISGDAYATGASSSGGFNFGNLTWQNTGGANDIFIVKIAGENLPVQPPTPCIPHRATGKATVVNGFLVGVTVTDAGCGYTEVPVVEILDRGGIGAQVSAIVTNGSLTAITVSNAGNGYTGTPTVLIASPPFTPYLDIAVSKVRVTQHMVLGKHYVLESTNDLKAWAQIGQQFAAQQEEVTQEFDVDVVGRYYRIRQVP